MTHYRRATAAGGTYFFTVVTYRWQRFLCDDDVRVALRESIQQARSNHPFVIDAWVLLPDHMHCVWTLPPADADFSIRWSAIKRGLTRRVGARLHRADLMNDSKLAHGESTLWQRRFWEHQIRDAIDLQAHVDYIHFNPVKHGFVASASDWSYSSIHRYIQNGAYPTDWGGGSASMVMGDVE